MVRTLLAARLHPQPASLMRRSALGLARAPEAENISVLGSSQARSYSVTALLINKASRDGLLRNDVCLLFALLIDWRWREWYEAAGPPESLLQDSQTVLVSFPLPAICRRAAKARPVGAASCWQKLLAEFHRGAAHHWAA